MRVLRLIFLLGCFVCLALAAWSAHWEGLLDDGNSGWLLDLGRAPIWAPPPKPTYKAFRENFRDSKDFPAQEEYGLTIERELKFDWLVVDLLLYLWPLTLVCGLLYLAFRGQRRDRFLHLALSAEIGLTIGALTCLAIWLALGGWGPPSPEFFGIVGFVGGMLIGLLTSIESVLNRLFSNRRTIT